MATFISHSEAETADLGESWGRMASSGLLVALSGDLGSGKTQLVKGVARGLGSDSRVQSPTFALVNIYEGGRLKLFHLDLYRLDTREQIRGAGLEDYFRPDGVAVVEWAERWFGNDGPANVPSVGEISSARYVRVFIEMTGETQRRITYDLFGA